ncbi:MAG TPA: hypothetical protein VGM23_06925, partial [Armatimonadota bacterium]
MRVLSLTVAALCVGLAVLLAGCADSARQTTATVTVDWPGRNISAPLASESVQVMLTGLNGYTATQVVDRPETGGASTLTFPNLPAGPVTVTITAYPQPGAAGVAQATATSQLTALT